MDLIKRNNISFDRRFRRSQDLQLTFETTLVAHRYISICDEYLYHNRTSENLQSLSRGYTKQYWQLIRPLIDCLYKDVKDYTKQNLLYYMHLCAFFFAASGIRNEYYGRSGLRKKDIISKLNEIATDDIIQNAINYIPITKLNKEYQAIYRGLKNKSGKAVYNQIKKYEIKTKFYYPIRQKVLSVLIKIPFARSIRNISNSILQSKK